VLSGVALLLTGDRAAWAASRQLRRAAHAVPAGCQESDAPCADGMNFTRAAFVAGAMNLLIALLAAAAPSSARLERSRGLRLPLRRSPRAATAPALRGRVHGARRRGALLDPPEGCAGTSTPRRGEPGVQVEVRPRDCGYSCESSPTKLACTQTHGAGAPPTSTTSPAGTRPTPRFTSSRRN